MLSITTITLYSALTLITIATNQPIGAIVTGSLLICTLAAYLHIIRRMKNEPNTN